MQSAVQPPAEVSKRILAFLATGPELVANNSADFRSFVAAAQALTPTPTPTLPPTLTLTLTLTLT